MKRILLAEDDEKICSLFSALVGQTATVTVADSASTLAAWLPRADQFDLLVLDRMLGSEDTKHALPGWRRAAPDLPVLVLSAINTPNERADLIRAGADDYIGKPFFAEELLARLGSLFRRVKNRDQRALGDSVIDLKRRLLSRGGRTEMLPAKEFLLLSALSEQPGRILSRADLLNLVWGGSDRAERNVVEATVTNLRRKLQGLDCSFRIRNTRNTGYWIEG